MRNVQIIDGASNATFSIFRATEEEYDAIFPEGRDIELIEDLVERLGHEGTSRILEAVWERAILKREAMGIHGTLFYDNDERRDHIPRSKREVDWDDQSLNLAQRALYARYR